jgi:hypothetical protein
VRKKVKGLQIWKKTTRTKVEKSLESDEREVKLEE